MTRPKPRKPTPKINFNTIARSIPPAAAVAPPPTEGIDPKRLSFLGDLATHLWRLKKTMTQPGSDRPLDEHQRSYRHLQAALDTLSQGGLQTRDLTGQPFDSGLPCRAIALQPTAGLTREMILETLRPIVIFDRSILQLGEVIVGVPIPPEQPV